MNSDLFKLKLVLSNEPLRLKLDTQEKITKEVGKYPGFERVWICGPPVMNQVFEKTVENMSQGKE
eukprot:CAMPEP_0116873044 /NCGR_PEP_ID=MMETSP0463-20121206/4007_1 /TAXON_ID=181622 /ORGANISM="Strombidinopsis sp, Strain SopsisLIS2011" /LENGTH=64 /DNA_ID=CAMNT_0004514297 /DNA_START=1472 /DNA_END=1663 /DNA_ORIENTATION=+